MESGFSSNFRSLEITQVMEAPLPSAAHGTAMDRSVRGRKETRDMSALSAPVK